MQEKERNYLEEKARQVRLNVMEMAYKAGGQSHPGPAMSCADIIAALYFKCMRIRPEEPGWEERDRFIISKGHACPALYGALAEAGYFPKEELYRLRTLGGRLQGHPDMNKTPGVDMTTGSLGHGLSAGVGMALALKLKNNPARVFVLLGDGESQEGLVWEAALSAPQHKLDNLIAIVDYNHFQSCGATEDIIDMEPFADKWRAFQWNVLEVNGHDMEDIVNKLTMAMRYRGRPSVILAHTVKGKGVSYMENNNAWHSKFPTSAEYDRALFELSGREANHV